MTYSKDKIYGKKSKKHIQNLHYEREVLDDVISGLES